MGETRQGSVGLTDDAHPPDTVSHPPSLRPTVTALFTGVGLSTAAYIAMITMAPLVAEDLLGSSRWSGLPSTVAIIGGALGTTVLARVMAHRGRFDGLLLGYAIAAIASVGAGVAVLWSSLSLFAISMFFVGAGAGANRLARYASADLYAADRRASAISWMVWGGTLGSVGGPALLEPSRAAAIRSGFEGGAGPYAMGTVALCLSAAALGLLGSRPLLSAVTERRQSARRMVGELFRIPRVRLAIMAMVVGQLVMVLIMTMTPIHIRHEGHGLASIGIVISAHTFGMYALSPVTGIMCDRMGRIPVIMAGMALLSISGLLAAGAGSSQPLLILALFVLGLGWNFGFVAGSALLTDDAPIDIRIQLQGVADSVIWGSGAVASLASGVLVAGWGYETLSLIGAMVSILPAVAVLRHWRLPVAT